MKEQLEQRLQELRKEFESGQKVLADLENRKTEIQNTLLRISGAMQVLEELLGQKTESTSDGLEQFEMASGESDAS